MRPSLKTLVALGATTAVGLATFQSASALEIPDDPSKCFTKKDDKEIAAKGLEAYKKVCYVLKLGTLAPKKSPWFQTLKKISTDIAKRRFVNEETQAIEKMKITIFAAGRLGDEKAMVEKIKTGQLDIVAVTAVGLGAVAPETLLFQVPGLIPNYSKLDKVRKDKKDDFVKAAESAGYTILGWSDVGEYNYYSQVPIRTPADLKKVKLWAWNADPAMITNAEVAGTEPVLGGVPEVLGDLNTGRINALYGSPLAVASLGWYKHFKYRTDYAVGMGIGAVLIKLETFNLMPEPVRKEMIAISNAAANRLGRAVRVKNEDAMEVLEGRHPNRKTKRSKSMNKKLKAAEGKPGQITRIDLTDAEKAQWNAHNRAVQDSLAGKGVILKSKASLAKIRKMAGTP